MKREEVIRIENRARKIMQMNPIQLKQKLKGHKLSILYSYILEDANFHQENETLTRMGVFGAFTQTHYPDGTIISSPKSYGSDNAEKLYQEIFKEDLQTERSHFLDDRSLCIVIIFHVSERGRM